MIGSDGMVSTLQVRKQELVREAIWDAAADLFTVKGFDETTVEDIAALAGVSRRTFFRYFASKSDLLAQGIVKYETALVQAIEECPAGMPLPEVMRRTVDRVAAQVAAHPSTRKVMAIVARHPAARDAQLSRIAGLQDSLTGAYRDRIQRSPDASLIAAVLASLTLTTLSLAIHTWYASGEPDIRSTVEQVLSAMRDGIGDALVVTPPGGLPVTRPEAPPRG